jgi:carbamoyl-phosphate synthase large subunit
LAVDFLFSNEAGVNFPKAIIEWLKGNPVDTSTLVPQYGRMFAKNDYLVEVGV